MGKILFFAVIGLAAYYILWRGANIRKSEIAKKADEDNKAETLEFDPRKNAYVPKKK